MRVPTDLSKLSQDGLRSFFNSFDTILFDCDGVIYNFERCFPGVGDSHNLLKDMGKQIKFVTNNTLSTRKYMFTKMVNGGMKVDINDIYTPTRVVVSYLKNKNFQKKLYVLGMDGMRLEFEEAGLEISNPLEADVVPTTTEGFYKSFERPNDIGAVISGFDFNTTMVSLNKAVLHLEDPEVDFIATGKDMKIPNFRGEYFIGPGYLLKVLEELSNRTAKNFGKPSKDLMDHLQEELQFNPTRTLFVGDSLTEDIGFGNQNGMQTLLVFTGGVKPDQLNICDDMCMPNFCINSYGDIHKLVKQSK